MQSHLDTQFERILNTLNGLARVPSVGEEGTFAQQFQRIAGAGPDVEFPSRFVVSYDMSDAIELVNETANATFERARARGVIFSESERDLVTEHIANSLLSTERIEAPSLQLSDALRFATVAVAQANEEITRFPNHALNGMRITAIARGARDEGRISQEIFDAIQDPRLALNSTIAGQAIEFENTVDRNMSVILRESSAETGQLNVASRKVIEDDTARVNDPDTPNAPSLIPKFEGLNVPAPRRFTEEEQEELTDEAKLRKRIAQSLPSASQLETPEEKAALSKFIDDKVDEAQAAFAFAEERGLGDDTALQAMEVALSQAPSQFKDARQQSLITAAQEERQEALAEGQTVSGARKLRDQFFFENGITAADIEPEDLTRIDRAIAANGGTTQGIERQIVEAANRFTQDKLQAEAAEQFGERAFGESELAQFAFNRGFNLNTLSDRGKQVLARTLSVSGGAGEVGTKLDDLVRQFQQEKANQDLIAGGAGRAAQAFLGVDERLTDPGVMRAVGQGAVPQLEVALEQALKRDPFADPQEILQEQFARGGAITPSGEFVPGEFVPFAEEELAQLQPGERAFPEGGRFAGRTGLSIEEQLEAVRQQFDPTSVPSPQETIGGPPALPGAGGRFAETAPLAEFGEIGRLALGATGGQDQEEFVRFLFGGAGSPNLVRLREQTGAFREEEFRSRRDESARSALGFFGEDFDSQLAQLRRQLASERAGGLGATGSPERIAEIESAIRGVENRQRIVSAGVPAAAAAITPSRISTEEAFREVIPAFRTEFEATPGFRAETERRERDREIEAAETVEDRRRRLRRGGTTTFRRIGR